MENDQFEMEARLWAYIDGLGTAQERSVIEELVAQQSVWRAKYGELLELHEALAATELEEPSMRFTRNVMEEIAKAQIAPSARSYINSRVIWGIAAVFIVTLLGFLVYACAQVDWSAAADSQSSFGIDLTKVNYMPAFSGTAVNIFMALNVVLALMLLDRYLDRQKKKHAAAS